MNRNAIGLWRMLWSGLLVLGMATGASAQDASIRIDARDSGRPVSRYLTGACIEDVNHEIYGGIYSQMLFGESFQEPAPTQPVKDFRAPEPGWHVSDGVVAGDAGPGVKLVSTAPAFADGEVGVSVYLPGREGGNAGLIVKVGRAGAGADNFDGYEVSIDVARKMLILGRHRHDFTLLKETPCDVSPDEWIPLVVKMTGRTLEVLVNGKSIVQYEDRDRPIMSGGVGLRQWQRPARYRNLWIKSGLARRVLPFAPPADARIAVSRMWSPVATGSAVLGAQIDKTNPFVGVQSQRLTFVSGAGSAGIANRGLNRQGLAFAAHKPYEGYLWLRADAPADLFVSLENSDGSRTCAATKLSVSGDQWKRYDFDLTPDADETSARLVISLKAPGSVVVGHAFLQPGEWDRFKGLPVRRDVVQGLIDQQITVLRYGGSMVNAPEYRWKKMIGPRDRRPPYRGTWYNWSTNGWGIIDFLNVCEAAGFLGIPDFNIDETPQDMLDFLEYVNGPVDTPWGRRRAADGHPQPYHLRHIELGNEERVDERYFARFKAIAEAIWAKDPQMTLVVGDFAYSHPITDPMHITGTASRITSLAAQQQILALARQHNAEVWFDVHVWTEGPAPSNDLKALPSFVDAIDKLADGARHKVVVFELNAGNHAQRRALANAQAIGTILRDGRLPVVTSANCLQPDGQNDNDWNQGLLFLNPTKVWLQPPGYVTQMIAENYQPVVVKADVSGVSSGLDVTATRSADGRTLVLQVVNLNDAPTSARIQFDGFVPTSPDAQVTTLAGALDAVNTADSPTHITPERSRWRHNLAPNKPATYAFPPHSFTILRFQ